LVDVNPAATSVATANTLQRATAGAERDTDDRAAGRRVQPDAARTEDPASRVSVSSAAQALLAADTQVGQPVAIPTPDNSPAGRLAQQFNELLGDAADRERRVEATPTDPARQNTDSDLTG
jgi:hypothetical protein